MKGLEVEVESAPITTRKISRGMIGCIAFGILVMCGFFWYARDEPGAEVGCLTADERTQMWNCSWCEEKLLAGKEVWLLHRPDAADPNAQKIGTGGFFQVYKAYDYKCPETEGAFPTPNEEWHHSAKDMLERYKKAADLVKDIPEMLEVLAFGPAVGSRTGVVPEWSDGLVSPLMQGSLHTWMNERNEYSSHNARIRCFQPIAKWLAGTVLKLHARSIAHCDIKPENILVRKVEQKCPEPFLADYDGLARPGSSKCISSIQYGAPIGKQTPSVIDWRATFTTLIEMYYPDLLDSASMAGMFGDDWDEENFEETLYEKAEATYEEVAEGLKGNQVLDPEATKRVLDLRPLLEAIHRAGKVDDEDSKFDLKVEEAQILKLISDKKRVVVNN